MTTWSIASPGGLLPGNAELVLGVPDPLLELPAVRLRFAALHALELRLGFLELPPRAVGVDLQGADGVVDERKRAVLLDLEEPGSGRELLHRRLGDVAPRPAPLPHSEEPCDPG